jgi:hypothetical protein
MLGELARRLQAETDPAQRQRLEDGVQLLLALRQFQAEMDKLSPQERLFLAFESTRSSQAIFTLILNTPDEALDGLEEEAEARLKTADANDAEAIRQRLTELRRLRGEGREALSQAAAAMQAGLEIAQALADRLVEWVRTPDWDASERYLQQHAAELLTDAGESALAQLQQANPDNDDIPLHQNLLRHCRADGIAAAYAHLRQGMQSVQELSQNPLLQQVIAFIRADGGERAAHRRRQPAAKRGCSHAAGTVLASRPRPGRCRDHRPPPGPSPFVDGKMARQPTRAAPPQSRRRLAGTTPKPAYGSAHARGPGRPTRHPLRGSEQPRRGGGLRPGRQPLQPRSAPALETPRRDTRRSGAACSVGPSPPVTRERGLNGSGILGWVV